MDIQTQKHPKIITKSQAGAPDGYLIPLYNIHDGFFRLDQNQSRFI